MNGNAFWSTLILVFLAEMGDKTQLATLSLAAGAQSRWLVFAGAASGLLLTSLLAVFAGGWVSQVIPAIWIRRSAGVLFLIFGALYLFGFGEP